MALRKKQLTFEEELAMGQAKLRKEILQWGFVPQLMLVPIILALALLLLGFSYEDAGSYSIAITSVVWVIWSSIKRSPASMVPAAAILAIGAVAGSFIFNGIDLSNPDNLSLLAISGVFIPLIASVFALVLMGFSLAIMSSIAFKKVFDYIPYDESTSEKPKLSSKISNVPADSVIKHSIVMFGGSFFDADKGRLTAHKDRLEFENLSSKEKLAFTYSDARGVIVGRRELILNMKNGERFYFAFFDRIKLSWGAVFSIGAMIIAVALGVPLWVAIAVPFLWVGGALKGFDSRIKELQEWRKLLHNFIDIEQMSGYPMRVSFAKFMSIVVLFMIAAFLLSVLVFNIAEPYL